MRDDVATDVGGTLWEAMVLAGAVAPGDPVIDFTRDLPADGTAVAGLGMTREAPVALVCPDDAGDRLARRGRWLGGVGEETRLVAFADVVACLVQRRGKTTIEAVATTAALAPGFGPGELARLAGELWVDDEKLAEWGGAGEGPRIATLVARMGDALMACGLGGGRAGMSLPTSREGRLEVVVDGPDGAATGADGHLARRTCWFAGREAGPSRLRSRTGGRPGRLASSWTPTTHWVDTGVVGTPGGSASLRTASVRGARERTMEWLVRDPSRLRLWSELTARWGGEA